VRSTHGWIQGRSPPLSRNSHLTAGTERYQEEHAVFGYPRPVVYVRREEEDDPLPIPPGEDPPPPVKEPPDKPVTRPDGPVDEPDRGEGTWL
jgi:hypothetical protein